MPWAPVAIQPTSSSLRRTYHQLSEFQNSIQGNGFVTEREGNQAAFKFTVIKDQTPRREFKDNSQSHPAALQNKILRQPSEESTAEVSFASCQLPPGVWFIFTWFKAGFSFHSGVWIPDSKEGLKVRTYLIYLKILGGKSNSCSEWREGSKQPSRQLLQGTRSVITSELSSEWRSMHMTIILNHFVGC